MYEKDMSPQDLLMLFFCLSSLFSIFPDFLYIPLCFLTSKLYLDHRKRWCPDIISSRQCLRFFLSALRDCS